MSHPSGDPAGTLRRRDWFPVAVVLMVCGSGIVGVALRLPRPHVDDNFFAGAAIAVAQGRGFVNPWINDWLAAYGTDRFLAQPPVYPWVVGAWLRCWGVGTVSLLAFQWAAMGICALGAAAWLRRSGATRAETILGMAIAYGAFWSNGLRPDALAFALIACGIALVADPSHRMKWFAGYISLALAPATLPLAAAFVLPAIVYVGLLRRGRWRINLACAAGGLAVALALVSLGIDHDWTEFWRVLSAHAENRSPPLSHAWVMFVHKATFGHELWLNLGILLAFLGSVTICVHGSRSLADARMLLAPGVLLVISAFLAVCLHATNAVPLCASALLLASLLNLVRLPWSSAKVAGVSIVLLALTVRNAAGIATVLNDLSRPAPDDTLIRDLARTTPRQRLGIDHFAMRQVFDYRPPANAIDWWFGIRKATEGDWRAALSRNGGPPPVLLAEKPMNEAWLVSEFVLSRTVPDSHAAPELMQIGTRKLGSLPRYPQPIRWIP